MEKISVEENPSFFSSLPSSATVAIFYLPALYAICLIHKIDGHARCIKGFGEMDILSYRII
jgi:hypothetical protein